MMELCTSLRLEEGIASLSDEDLRLVGADGEDDLPDGINPDDLDDDSANDDEDEDDDSDDEDEDDEDEESEEIRNAKAKLKSVEGARDRFKTQRDKARNDLAAARAEIEDLKKNGTKDETLKQELQTAKSENTALSQSNRKLQIENAFLADSSQTWKDRSAAIKLLDLSEVSIDDDGTVEGMADAIASLSEKYPFLLEDGAPAKRQRKQQSEDDEDQPKPRKTGDRPGSRQKQTATQRATETQKLRSKYPALRK